MTAPRRDGAVPAPGLRRCGMRRYDVGQCLLMVTLLVLVVLAWAAGLVLADRLAVLLRRSHG